MASELHTVTGAFGYSGRFIANRLIQAGHQVATLTNSPRRGDPLGARVEARPFDFDKPDQLEASLRGTTVLYNTYWVRHKSFGFARAIENSRVLFRAARDAGVRRIVHVSITNPSDRSELEYFRGKATLERELIELGIPYSILRPAVLFGGPDILINNIAWTLRRLPVFGVFGDGQYRLQPIHICDFAELAVREGGHSENRIIDAIGPETFTYRELVQEIAAALRLRRPVVSVHPSIAYAAGWLLGRLLRDVVITRDEIEGLMQDLLYTDSAPAGQRKLSEWARQNAETLGRCYASELGRGRDRRAAYQDAR
ncbi:MAG: NAD(P)H-binding protein [Myxococcota bacterium]